MLAILIYFFFPKVSRLRLPRHYGDDCQLLAFRVDGRSMETPTFDGPPRDPYLTSRSLHRMCRQTCACIPFRLITRCFMSHLSQVCLHTSHTYIWNINFIKSHEWPSLAIYSQPFHSLNALLISHSSLASI